MLYGFSNWRRVKITSPRNLKAKKASFIVSCPCLWKRVVELEEKVEVCGSWGRWRLAVLAFIPFAATVALTIYIMCE